MQVTGSFGTDYFLLSIGICPKIIEMFSMHSLYMIQLHIASQCSWTKHCVTVLHLQHFVIETVICQAASIMSAWIFRRLLCLDSQNLATLRSAAPTWHKTLLLGFHFRLNKAMLCCCWPKAQSLWDVAIFWHASLTLIKNLPTCALYMIFITNVEETNYLLKTSHVITIHYHCCYNSHNF